VLARYPAIATRPVRNTVAAAMPWWPARPCLVNGHDPVGRCTRRSFASWKIGEHGGQSFLTPRR
jgi:hypothetical protein